MGDEKQSTLSGLLVNMLEFVAFVIVKLSCSILAAQLDNNSSCIFIIKVIML